jgi:uncharacterized lipoprotein
MKTPVIITVSDSEYNKIWTTVVDYEKVDVVKMKIKDACKTKGVLCSVYVPSTEETFVRAVNAGV